MVLFTIAGYGHAQFGAPQPLPFAAPNSPPVAVDMNADGHLDLVGLFNNTDLMWSSNTDGNGSFGALELIATIAPTPLFLQVSDLHLNGLPDLVFVSTELSVYTVMNLGNGQFDVPALVYQMPSQPGAMACQDITGDGLPELIFSLQTADGSGFGWATNNGIGFQSLEILADVLQGPASAILLVGDLDQLGGNDVVIQDGSGMVHVFRNMVGDAGTWTADVVVAFPANNYLRPVLLDMDADGDLDLAEARNEVVHWAENRLGEGGSWTPFTDHGLEWNEEAGDGLFGDVGCGPGASVIYLPGNEALPMRWRTYLPTMNGVVHAGDLPDLPRSTLVALADLDGDMRPDVVALGPDGLFWCRSTVSLPNLELDMPVFDTLCVFGPPVALPPMLPTGGRWSGEWVIDDILHRANIGTTGDIPLAHAVYEPDGCPVADVSTFRLMIGPAVTPDLAGVICSGGDPIHLQAQPANVSWSGGIGANGILDPDSYAGGSFACAYTDATGMQCATIIGPIAIWSTVPVVIAPAGPFCINDAIQGISASVMPPQGGTWSGDIAGTLANVALFNPSMGAGTYQVVLHVQPAGPQQCANSDTLLITVNDDIPDVTVESIATLCVQGSAVQLQGGSPEGGTWSGPGIQGGVLEPSVAGSGTHQLAYTYQAPSGCQATANTALVLVDQVLLSWNSDDLIFCPGDEPLQFGALPSGGLWSAPVSTEGIFDPASLSPGDYPLVYTWESANNCTLQNADNTLVLWSLSEVLIDPVPVLCDDGPPVEITADLAGIWSGAVSGTGTSVWLDPALLGAGTFVLQLVAAAPEACPATATVDVVVDHCSGIGEALTAFTIHAAPNPFETTTWLHLPAGIQGLAELFDATGRCVHVQRIDAGSGPWTLQLGTTPAGTYHLRFTSAEGMVRVLRLVKG